MTESTAKPSRWSRLWRKQPHPATEAFEARTQFMGVPRKVMQGITAVVTGALLNMSLMPLSMAYQQQRQQERMQAAANPNTAEDQYVRALESLNQAATVQAKSSSLGFGSSLGNVATMESYAKSIRAEWEQLRATWKAANVPQEVIDRQLKIEAEFEAKHQELLLLLKMSNGQKKAVAVSAFLKDNLPKAPHLPINLDNMPWQVLKADAIEPAHNEAEINRRIGLEPRQMLKAATPATPADYASTIDAPQTDEIKALAASLNKDVYKIYKWVYDNIEYFPSHGSVQGAQDTLDKKSGNAIDQANLLVALLRASGIAARYVYGTVEMPADKVMNWVGDTKTSDAAQQILGQGGVPNTALVSGGKVTTMRIEHVWVEAFIQYYPSRGIRHIPGVSVPDTWVPLDPSYKQSVFKDGMDLQAAVPFDANALLASVQQGAEVNEAEGWVRNVNSAAVESQLKAYQNQMTSYINSQNGGQSTVGDVLGTQKITPYLLPFLPNTLPYTVKTRSQQFSDVPDRLRPKFQYAIYADQRSAAWGDSPLVSWQAPTVSIAGKKVTIAWVAANAANQAAIEALIPTPAPGQQLDLSKLPTGLPSSISLKPEIRLDGEVMTTGPAMRAGDEPVGAGAFTNYNNQWDTTTDQLIAGQQTALGISIQGVSKAQLETLKKRMEATKSKLQQAQALPDASRPAFLQGMTGEQLTGDMLTATIWGYLTSLQSYGNVTGSRAGLIDKPALQYGLFHAQVQPRKLYGIVTTGINFKGMNIDVGHIRSIRWVRDDNHQSHINSNPDLIQNGRSAAQNRWISYNKAKGNYSSALEHKAPEEHWVNKNDCRYIDSDGRVRNSSLNDCVEGVSAVKSIQIALSQGQKIYIVNDINRENVLRGFNIGGDVGSEIRNAIQAGKEVVFHEKSISYHGWSGYGYVIIDPDTGAGAYLIEGHGNGGWILIILGALLLGFLAYGAIGVALGYFVWYVTSNAIGALFALAVSAIVAGIGMLFDNSDATLTGAVGMAAALIALVVALPIATASFIAAAPFLAAILVLAGAWVSVRSLFKLMNLFNENEDMIVHE